MHPPEYHVHSRCYDLSDPKTGASLGNTWSEDERRGSSRSSTKPFGSSTKRSATTAGRATGAHDGRRSKSSGISRSDKSSESRAVRVAVLAKRIASAKVYSPRSVERTSSSRDTGDDCLIPKDTQLESKCVVCQELLHKKSWSEFVGDPRMLVLGGKNPMREQVRVYCPRCGLRYEQEPQSRTSE